MRRPALLTFGWTSLALAVAGAVLPLLPTTPFLLLAAACFARSSEPMHRWLLGHRLFGPTLRDWERHGAVRARTKTLATLLMTGLVAWPLIYGEFAAPLKVVAGASVAGVLIFLWSRPSPPPRPPGS